MTFQVRRANFLLFAVTSTGSSLPGLGLPTDSLAGSMSNLLASIVSVVESLVKSLVSSVPLPYVFSPRPRVALR